MRKREISERQQMLASAVAELDHWRPARQVLTPIVAQPTCFIQIDRAVKCGGWPIQRFGVIHGPSNHGKTVFLLGLGLSFLTEDSIFAMVDAEYTTNNEWITQLMSKWVSHPGFIAKRPRNYDETVSAVTEIAKNIVKWRNDGRIHPDTTALIGVDSINKLVPQKLLAKIMKGEGGQDGADGRAGQMIAAINNQWLRSLIPQLYHAKIGLAVIAREYSRTKVNIFDQGPDYTVAGGQAINYDSSLRCRVSRAGYVQKKVSGKKPIIYGERHRVDILKTKVGGKEDKYETGYFHTSNGVLTPFGFDRARDVIEEGISQGTIELSGSTYSDASTGEVLGRGIDKAVVNLTNSIDLLNDIEHRTREAFSS